MGPFAQSREDRPPRVVVVPGRAGPVGHPPAPCSLTLRADAGARGRHPREQESSHMQRPIKTFG